MKTIEEWRSVPSLEGVKVSSWGRIRLPESTGLMPNGSFRRYKTKPTYGYKTSSRKGAKHIYMNLCNRKLGNIKVHRAVCEAFHGAGTDDCPVVIHIDEDSTNNEPSNLRWGTQKENLNCKGFLEYASSVCTDKMRGRKVNSSLI